MFRRAAALGLILLGIALVGWVLVRGSVEAHQTAEAQKQLAASVPTHAQAQVQPVAAGTQLRAVATRVATGRPFVVMDIPRFGKEWRWVALEGTEPDVLADGPGHYAWTPLPGERGNVAFAAHRAGHGDPFIDFDKLRIGDRVVLRQGSTTWVYELDSDPRIIPTSAAWVLAPMAGHRLTLTTCWPKYGSSKRMYVRGHLVS
jgi:sortase A